MKPPAPDRPRTPEEIALDIAHEMEAGGFPDQDVYLFYEKMIAAAIQAERDQAFKDTNSLILELSDRDARIAQYEAALREAREALTLMTNVNSATGFAGCPGVARVTLERIEKILEGAG